MKKILCLTLAALLLPVLLLTGCGRQETPFQVLMAAPYVNQELAAAYAETLGVACSGFSFGSDAVDGVTYGASAMMMTAMMAAGEVDVLVCELGEAARYARSEYFLDLTEVFTAEELASVSERLLTFELVDEEGNPTGEQTPSCGLDLSGREDLTCLLGCEQYGIFIVCNTEDLDAAKGVFWNIVKESPMA